MLTERERATLTAALDALLPTDGSFPWPSATGIVDDFLLKRIPQPGAVNPEWPGMDMTALRAILARLGVVTSGDEMTDSLAALERDDAEAFLAFWRLAVFGYYSRPEVIAAIASDLAPNYHGAPLPQGYAHLMAPWNARDPLQLPVNPRGSYVPTNAVRRVDLDRLRAVQKREAGE